MLQLLGESVPQTPCRGFALDPLGDFRPQTPDLPPPTPPSRSALGKWNLTCSFRCLAAVLPTIHICFQVPRQCVYRQTVKSDNSYDINDDDDDDDDDSYQI